jgi:hypothetical protein
VAQTAFITAIAYMIPNVSPSSITITRIYEIDIPDIRKPKDKQKILVIEWKLNVVLQDVVELNGTPPSNSKAFPGSLCLAEKPWLEKYRPTGRYDQWAES